MSNIPHSTAPAKLKPSKSRSSVKKKNSQQYRYVFLRILHLRIRTREGRLSMLLSPSFPYTA